MKSISLTEARENLSSTMKAVCDERQPVMVTRSEGCAVVMVSLDDYVSMQEISYLRKSPENARRLDDAIAQLESGKGVDRELCFPEDYSAEHATEPLCYSLIMMAE